MEDCNKERNTDPKQRRQTTQTMPMFMLRQHMMRMRISFVNIPQMQRMLQFLHMLLIRRDIQYRRDWFGQFHRELLRLFRQRYRRVETACVAGVEGFIRSVDGDDENGFVVGLFTDADADAEMGFATVGNSTEIVGSMEFRWEHPHFEVIVAGVTETAQAENEGLQVTFRSQCEKTEKERTPVKSETEYSDGKVIRTANKNTMNAKTRKHVEKQLA